MGYYEDRARNDAAEAGAKVIGSKMLKGLAGRGGFDIPEATLMAMVLADGMVDRLNTQALYHGQPPLLLEPLEGSKTVTTFRVPGRRTLVTFINRVDKRRGGYRRPVVVTTERGLTFEEKRACEGFRDHLVVRGWSCSAYEREVSKLYAIDTLVDAYDAGLVVTIEPLKERTVGFLEKVPDLPTYWDGWTAGVYPEAPAYWALMYALDAMARGGGRLPPSKTFKEDAGRWAFRRINEIERGMR